MVVVRTLRVRGHLARGCCLAIGYPVAYYIARHATRTKSLLLILLILPFWISYLMRMLAWVEPARAGRVREPVPDVGARDPDRRTDFLDGQSSTVILALIYGYIPYFILPLYASLDRIDRSYLEAARDLGASPSAGVLARHAAAQRRPGMLGGLVLIALPMFGEYYTPNMVSGAPTTSMLGNQIDLYFHGGPQPTIGAALTIILSLLPGGADGLLHARRSHRASKELAQ